MLNSVYCFVQLKIFIFLLKWNLSPSNFEILISGATEMKKKNTFLTLSYIVTYHLFDNPYSLKYSQEPENRPKSFEPK